jgi:hypothetical protein
MVCVFGVAVTVGVGFTVIVKLNGVPLQETPPTVFCGVTVMVATTGAFPVLMAVNDGNKKRGDVAVPLAASPIDVLLLVQGNEVTFVPANVTAVVEEPLQTDWFAGVTVDGRGLKVTVRLSLTSAQGAAVFVV